MKIAEGWRVMQFAMTYPVQSIIRALTLAHQKTTLHSFIRFHNLKTVASCNRATTAATTELSDFPL